MTGNSAESVSLSHQDTATHDQPELPNELLLALDRLFHIGSFYPKGHFRREEVAQEFYKQLEFALLGHSTLVIDISQDALLVQGQLSSTTSCRGTKRVHEIFISLGIARIEIDNSATSSDLLDFVSVVLKCRMQIESSQALDILESNQIPATIRITEREFGKYISGSSASTFAEQKTRLAIDDVVTSIAELDLPPDKQNSYEDFVNNVFTRVSERLETNFTQTEDRARNFNRALDEVLYLGVHALEHALGEMSLDSDTTANSHEMLEFMEKAIGLSDDQESVELILDVLKQIDSENPARTKSATHGQLLVDPEHDPSCNLALTELKNQFANLTKSAEPPLSRQKAENCAQLSALAQILIQYPSETLLTNIGHNLKVCLTSPLEPNEHKVLLGAISGLISSFSVSRVDESVPLLLRPLRHSNSMAFLLVDICRDLKDEQLELIWPHLVNEILLGLPNQNPEIQKQLFDLVGQLPSVRMEKVLPRLAKRSALQERKFAPDLFQPPVPELFPLFAQLLVSECGTVIGKQLFRGWQKHPPTWLGSAAL